MSIRISALVLASMVWFCVSQGSALACSCGDPFEPLEDFRKVLAWRFAQARDVVRGPIVGARHGVRLGGRVVLARMLVHTVMKGNVPIGDVNLVTSEGGPACGMGSSFLQMVQKKDNQDISLELNTHKELPNEFTVDTCSYYSFGPDPNLQPR